MSVVRDGGRNGGNGLLNEMLDEAVDDEITLGCEDDGEILLIGAVIPFMRRVLNRNKDFYEVVVPGYCVDDSIQVPFPNDKEYI